MNVSSTPGPFPPGFPQGNKAWMPCLWLVSSRLKAERPDLKKTSCLLPLVLPKSRLMEGIVLNYPIASGKVGQCLGLILVSEGCCNKVLQTRCLKTIGMYPLIVLEAINLKSRCQHALSKDFREELFLAFSSVWWLLAILGIPWLVNTSRQPFPSLSLGIRLLCR